MRGKPFLVYAIVLSVAEQAVLLFVLLWVLPRAGLVVPAWAVALLAASRALNQTPIQSPDVGARGRVVQALDPRGYVKVGNELWSAEIEGPHLGQGEEVVVLQVSGLHLTVAAASESMERETHNRAP